MSRDEEIAQERVRRRRVAADRSRRRYNRKPGDLAKAVPVRCASCGLDYEASGTERAACPRCGKVEDM